MPILTRRDVKNYIQEGDAVAASEAELLCIRLAERINSTHVIVAAKRKARGGESDSTSGVGIPEIMAEADEGEGLVWGWVHRNPDSAAQRQVNTWRTLILEEIHAALCTRKKYKKQVADLKKNADLLIVAISGYLACVLGVAVGVIAALVAALLRIACAMGITVFCRKFSATA